MAYLDQILIKGYNTELLTVSQRGRHYFGMHVLHVPHRSVVGRLVFNLYLLKN